MRLILLITLLLAEVLNVAGGEKNLKGKPVTLEQTYAYLDRIFDDTSAYGFMTMPEDIATARLHMPFGMWIRNNWGLWRGGKLSQYFVEKGIRDPEAMSDIILTSYHRYLNKKPIDLDDQVKVHKQHSNNMDSVFTSQIFGRNATNSALVKMFPLTDTMLVSVYARYKKGLKHHASGVSATAIVREHHGDKLLVELINIKSKPHTTPDRKVGDIYEESLYGCRLLPPPGWHRR